MPLPRCPDRTPSDRSWPHVVSAHPRHLVPTQPQEPPQLQEHARGPTFARQTWWQVWTPWAELSHRVWLQGKGASAVRGPEDVDTRPALPVCPSPERVSVTRRCHAGDVSGFRWLGLALSLLLQVRLHGSRLVLTCQECQVHQTSWWGLAQAAIWVLSMHSGRQAQRPHRGAVVPEFWLSELPGPVSRPGTPGLRHPPPLPPSHSACRTNEGQN